MGRGLAGAFLVAAGILEAIGASTWPCLFGAGLCLIGGFVVEQIEEELQKKSRKAPKQDIQPVS